MRHTTLATARLRFLFLGAKIWRHAGRVGVSYSDHYEDKGLFQRLMGRLRDVSPGGDGFLPVLQTAGPEETSTSWPTGPCIKFYALLPSARMDGNKQR